MLDSRLVARRCYPPRAAPEPAALTIRTMTRADLRRALDQAAAEGWNPGLHDAEAFHAADPEGFLCSDHASIAAIRTGADQGFIGLYIVRPESRGQGHGLAIWRAAMERLAGRNIGLDGVVAQQANYRRSGFRFCWNNARYRALSPRLPPQAHDTAPALPDDELVAFDAAHAGAPRPGFLRAWIETPGHRALVVREGGAVAGLGVRRPCREGSKIGPLFAASPAIAASLLAALGREAPPGPLILDLPDDHADAVALAEGCGMQKVFETARMYTGGPPPLRRKGIFAVTSFELG